MSDLLTLRYRPMIFDDVIGQEDIVAFLKSVASKKQVPQSIILLGPYGTGKTTLSRIFAKALNCLKPVNGSPCYECKHCKDDTIFYREYDTSLVGNVEFMRNFVSELKFSYVPTGYHEVIVFDESHLMSAISQSPLLKVLEDSFDKVRFMFCTTETDGMLKTILSRSLILELQPVSAELIAQRLTYICASEGLAIDSETIEKIAVMSRGHVRDAVKHIDFLRYGGTPDSLPHFDMLIYYDLIAAIKEGEDEFRVVLYKVMDMPMFYIRHTFYEFLESLMHRTVSGSEGLPLSKQEALSLVKTSLEPWVHQALNTSVQTAYAFFYYIYASFAKSQSGKATDWRGALKKK